jgi:hypothetical protein
MAFNPFNWFRKHQKVLIAGLAIMCMVLFVFSFGAGDPIQQGLRLIGASRSGGPVVTSLYGKKITERDLQQLSKRRRLANNFMFLVVNNAHDQVIQTLEKDLKNDPAPLEGLRKVVQNCRDRVPQIIRTATQRDSALGQGAPREFVRMFFGAQVPQLAEAINRDLGTVATMSLRKGIAGTEYLDTLQKVAALLGFQLWQVENFDHIHFDPRTFEPYLPDAFYFGGGRKTEDLLDFLVWKQQADKLGINLTDADVRNEINFEAARDVFAGRTFADDRGVKNYVRNFADPDIRIQDLVDALREELRVAMAQGLLLGQEPGARAYRTRLGASDTPASFTPDEFLRYFRSQRTTLNVAMLTVPVADFLKKVTGSPTEEALRERYETYKNDEPAPDRREPAFKEPRRIQVAHVSASPGDPFYKAEGRKLARHLPVFQTGAVLGMNPLAATSFVAASLRYPDRKKPPILANLALRQEYEAYRASLYSADTGLDEANLRARIYDNCALTSYNAATTFGQLLGTAQTGGSPLEPLLAYYARAQVIQTRRHMRFALSLLAGVPTNPLSAVVMAMPNRPRPLSFRRMRTQMMAAVEERFAEQVLTKNMNTFREEMAKLKSQPEKAEAYAQKALKEYHFRYGTMPSPRSAHAIEDALKRNRNLGLRGLVQAFRRRNPGARPADMVGSLFRTTGRYEPIPVTEFGSLSREATQYWRKQDVKAEVRPFQAVRSKVVAAWRLERARQLAARQAEKIEATINAKKLSAADAERLLREQGHGPLFELKGVAELLPPREVLPLARVEYRPYQVPESQAEEFPYPRPDLVKQLMTLERPGQATVLADRPARRYYVAVLLERDEPSVKEFSKLYGRSPRSDTLLQRFEQQRREDYKREVLEQLRREAGKVDAEGRFDLDEKVRQRETGRGDEG